MASAKALSPFPPRPTTRTKSGEGEREGRTAVGRGDGERGAGESEESRGEHGRGGELAKVEGRRWKVEGGGKVEEACEEKETERGSGSAARLASDCADGPVRAAARR